jgi:hypothetical protein
MRWAFYGAFAVLGCSSSTEQRTVVQGVDGGPEAQPGSLGATCETAADCADVADVLRAAYPEGGYPEAPVANCDPDPLGVLRCTFTCDKSAEMSRPGSYEATCAAMGGTCGGGTRTPCEI